MAMEEDGDVNESEGKVWVSVRVFIEDYHNLGDPCFNSHFRMSRTVFEVNICCQCDSPTLLCMHQVVNLPFFCLQLLSTTVFNHSVQNGRLRRERTPMQDILLMVLWLLATQDTFRRVALRFGVNPPTLYYYYL